MAIWGGRRVPKNGRLGENGLSPHKRRHANLKRVDALRASEHRHTDFTDLNGFHGYFGSQCFTVVNGVSQCGRTSCMRR